MHRWASQDDYDDARAAAARALQLRHLIYYNAKPATSTEGWANELGSCLARVIKYLELVPPAPPAPTVAGAGAAPEGDRPGATATACSATPPGVSDPFAPNGALAG